jgi:hypothetical protein
MISYEDHRDNMTSETTIESLPVLKLYAAEIASTASQRKAREIGISTYPYTPDLK